MPTKRSPGLTRSANFGGGYMKKTYRYEADQDLSVLRHRMDLASRCSGVLDSIPEISWTGDAAVVEVAQRRVQSRRLEPGPDAVSALAGLARDLDAMTHEGMIHGDMNRKNILWTGDGFQVIDVEPLLCVRRADGRTVLRGTPPYVHPDDLRKNRISTLSDRLGFACLVEWLRKRVSRPSEAVPRMQAHVPDRSFFVLSQ